MDPGRHRVTASGPGVGVWGTDIDVPSDGAVHRVLNPMPLYLGGDVVSSSANGLGHDVHERLADMDALGSIASNCALFQT